MSSSPIGRMDGQFLWIQYISAAPAHSFTVNIQRVGQEPLNLLSTTLVSAVCSSNPKQNFNSNMEDVQVVRARTIHAMGYYSTIDFKLFKNYDRITPIHCKPFSLAFKTKTGVQCYLGGCTCCSCGFKTCKSIILQHYGL